MQINYNKFKSGKYNKNFRFIKIFIFGLFVILILILLVFFIKKKNIFIANDNKEVYKKFFDEKNYLDLIKMLDSELKKNAFNQKNLVYRGYSYFFLAEDEENLSKKKIFLNLSLIDLRKAIAIGVPRKNIGNIYFVLGKIYYYFGEPYYYQSLKFLKNSLEYNNKRIDLLYILGLLYSNMGDYKESIKYYLDALKYEESDLLLLAIANSYFKDNDFNNSKIFINKILESSNNNLIIEKCYLLLGIIVYNENDPDLSITYFDKVIELNENNSQAYFYRGEIYYQKNNLIKARAEWRKTLEIDPSYIKAQKRLYY